MADLNTPDLASEDSPDRAGRTAAGTGRVRFPLVRWVLAPRTTWQAWRLAADSCDGMDARTAWVMARLACHPDERGYAMTHLDGERRTADHGVIRGSCREVALGRAHGRETVQGRGKGGPPDDDVEGDSLLFRRSEEPKGQRVRLLRNAVATKPSTFRGGDRREGWVLYRWDTEFGRVVLAFPVWDGVGMVMPSASLLDELAHDAAALAVVEADYNIPHGPSLEAVDAAAPDTPYGTTWKLLEGVLGHPAPYWHSSVRDSELMMQWKPGAPALRVPVRVTPDPGPLLRLAAEEPDGSHAAAAALHTVRKTVWAEASNAMRHIAEYVDASEDIASIAVAARPVMPHPPEDVAEEILRDGWRMILARPDVLAARCARLGQVLGASRYFPGACEITVEPSSCAEAAQWASRLLPSPRTALAAYPATPGSSRSSSIRSPTCLPYAHATGRSKPWPRNACPPSPRSPP